jgi:hypothetical protein
MFTLFSILFAAIFTAFVAAAIVGHIMLIDALLRPFFAKLASVQRPAPARYGSLQAAG